ncbi:MAG: hypothetical protein WD771_02130 [Gemmatimonadaceae bacterium]
MRSALDASVAGGYSDLVTRRTGAAVRTVIERQLAGLADGTVAFLDFSHIGILDHSCADEFIAKLMLPLTNDHPSRDGYVVFHGVSEMHVDAIESALEAHGLALVVQFPDGTTRLVGAVSESERRLWDLVMHGGPAPAEQVAERAGLPCDDCRSQLESLARKRLLRHDHDLFAPLGAAA